MGRIKDIFKNKDITENMYKCVNPSDWLYVECGYAYAVG